MFDIGFWELVVVGVVALIVLGPERLPGIARKVGMWVGRVRRFVNETKADIDREIRLQDIQKAIERDASIDEIKKIIDTERYSIEDEVKKTEYVVKAQPDEPLKEQFDEPVDHQQENAQYGHTQHRVLEEEDPAFRDVSPSVTTSDTVSAANVSTPATSDEQSRPKQ